MKVQGRLAAPVWTLSVLAFLAVPTAVNAHSASDAYLTLMTEPAASSRKASIHGQWDIALRDLDFVLKLDTNGDGRLTWGEVRDQRFGH